MKIGAVRTSGNSANKVRKSNTSAIYHAENTVKIRTVKICSVLLPERFGFCLAPSAPKRVSPEFSVFSGPILFIRMPESIAPSAGICRFPEKLQRDFIYRLSLPRADILIYSTTNDKRSQ